MKRILILLLSAALLLAAGCSSSSSSSESSSSAEVPASSETESGSAKTEAMRAIEEALDLENMDAEWSYAEGSDSWTLSIITAVTAPEIADEEGVSVCVPGAYVKGIDTDGDGEVDVTSGTAVGDLIIDPEGTVTSSSGQVYTAATAPVIINTGAAGYSEQQNQTASATYAAEGYINVACGNRGKQSTMTDEDGNTVYTGDAPSCLVDQKNAVRFVKYNILLGNLPGSVDHFVSTGGSGGGAHAVMLAATSDNPDFYDYEIAVGAVGVYQDEEGNYITSVTIDGEEVELSDGMWGCMAYSAITSLQEADMAMAFEYLQDDAYSFNTSFQKQTAVYLAEKYQEYINGKDLSVSEAALGFDLNEDGDTSDTVALTIEQAEDGTYSGTYLDLYLKVFKESLNSYLARLVYADGWTWFNEDGSAMSDEEVAALTSEERAVLFLEGRYAKSSSGGGGMPGDGGGFPGGDDGPGGEGGPGGNAPSGEMPGGGFPGNDSSTEEVGTPDAGTTQSASGSTDSANYASFSEMLAAYQADIAEVEAGDKYGNNIVELYDPTSYIGDEETNDPTWARILMGASEGDISMLNSMNLLVAWLNAGTDAHIEWQWDGGHVPSEVLGDSFALYVDTMYAKHAGGNAVENTSSVQTTNGTATEASGTDLTSWISYDSEEGVSFSLSDIAAYRTAGASKAVPGFDVMDYGQEDYVFGSSEKDARHWNRYLLEVFEENEEMLSELFNQ
ncbi:MAG: hypothetical protein IKE21_01045 [Erysipelotrichaceae bacterium]|nr:hypothetical protein [Erysipelotrichaceae bacterium]